MKRIYFLLVYLLLTTYYLLIFGCGKKEVEVVEEKTIPAPQPITALIEKKIEEKYVYRGVLYRDPFLPVSKRRMTSSLTSTEERRPPNLAALTLKGIIRDRISAIALLSSPEGSYIAKNGKLYDNLNRLVPEITTKIDKESVTLTTEDEFTKIYKLREE